MAVADWRTSSRRSVQAAERAGTSSSIPKRCPIDCFGKYVPAKKGRLSGVITTVMGQPPLPVRAWVTVM